MTIVEEGAGGEGFTFTVTGEATAGPQIVKILNASDQPHFVIGFHYPEEITIEQAMEFIMFDPSSGATPSAGHARRDAAHVPHLRTRRSRWARRSGW